MIDLKKLRDKPEEMEALLRRRGPEAGDLISKLSVEDQKHRSALTALEGKRSEKKKASKEFGALKRTGGSVEELQMKIQVLDKEMASLQKEVDVLNQKMNSVLYNIPNLPLEEVTVGADESGNKEIRKVEAAASAPLNPKPHWEIGVELGLVDFERAAKISGARFYVLTGEGARLERALLNFMLDLHTQEGGYKEIFPPFLVNQAAMTGTGQFPKFGDEYYTLSEDDLSLIPTAEVPLTNLHANEILEADQLPIKYTAYTACFRREAGAAGKDTRGVTRVHQFNKVELVRFERPEDSRKALDELTADAEKVLQRLGLAYRVLELCTGDLGFSSAKTYDLEVWMPGQNRYVEISSCSIFTDFQARRAKIRYRPSAGEKPQLLHTLNGSGVAIGRAWAAILENYLQEDGSVLIPEVLRPYMGGKEKIGGADRG